MAASNGERASQVRIQLKARDPDIELPDQGAILVSTELKRYQLSTLVNKLLDSEKPIPLEFLINGQFLRTSLDEFLTQNGISAETTLNVEYVRALIPPLFVASFEHEDWVSAIHSVDRRILSASFDGSVSVWNDSAELVVTGTGWHRGSVHSTKFLGAKTVVSGGSDRSVRLWGFDDQITPGQQGKLTPKLELQGHQNSVDRIAVHAASSRILSASADHTIGFWSSKKAEGSAAPEPTAPSSKRRKLSGPSISTPTRGALSMLSGHANAVKDVAFDAEDPTVAYSCSLDHTVKTWDLTTSTAVDSKTTSQPLLSLCHLPSHSLVAVGTDQGFIDLVDIRASATKVSALRCIGHTNWVRSIARDPNSPYQFVSGSQDSTCKIWDVRSTSQSAAGASIAKAVYTISRESQKGAKQVQGSESTVYGVHWSEELGIISGGEDKRVQVNKAP